MSSLRVSLFNFFFPLVVVDEIDRNGEKESITIENPLHIQQPLIETVIAELLGKEETSNRILSALKVFG